MHEVEAMVSKLTRTQVACSIPCMFVCIHRSSALAALIGRCSFVAAAFMDADTSRVRVRCPNVCADAASMASITENVCLGQGLNNWGSLSKDHVVCCRAAHTLIAIGPSWQQHSTPKTPHVCFLRGYQHDSPHGDSVTASYGARHCGQAGEVGLC